MPSSRSNCCIRYRGQSARDRPDHPPFSRAPTDVIELDGILVTTPVRTAFDVGRITPDWRGLGHLDALHRATRFSVADLCRYVEWHAGWRHIRQLRAIAPLIDGAAESPPESWLRLLMFRGGLPTPELQIEVADESGHVFARADIGYREEKVDIEYDGEEFHGLPWQRARDARRDAKLKALGWKVIPRRRGAPSRKAVDDSHGDRDRTSPAQGVLRPSGGPLGVGGPSRRPRTAQPATPDGPAGGREGPVGGRGGPSRRAGRAQSAGGEGPVGGRGGPSRR